MAAGNQQTLLYPAANAGRNQSSRLPKTPDMVKAEAERAFAQVKVDYTSEYAAISTYKGRIALNELRKAELLLQKLKQKVDQEVSDAYEKAVAAKKALDESTAAKDEAWKTYHATLTDYANKKYL